MGKAASFLVVTAVVVLWLVSPFLPEAPTFFLARPFLVEASGISSGAGGGGGYVVPGPSANTSYCSSSGAVNTAIECIFAAQAGQRWHVRLISARCLGLAGTANLRVYDGGANTFWDAGGAPNPITTTLFTTSWPVGLAGLVGGQVRVELGACGATSAGWLTVSADRF